MALMVSPLRAEDQRPWEARGWGEELAGDILGAAAMGEFVHKRRRSCVF
jgi:hypothetical protein